MKEYIHKGKCIWCLKEKTEVSFNNEPHTISRKLGSTMIGVDICDACNSYFGTSTKDKFKEFVMSPELAFKEIFNIIKFLFKQNKNENSYKELKSRYFNYHHSRLTIQIKKSFEIQPRFLRNFTRQFKRGVYEVFLQEYHRCTKNGLDTKFNTVRNFARFGIGDLPLYFLKNNGIYFVEENFNNPSLAFTEQSLTHINECGFYQMLFLGHVFFLEVTPRAIFTRDKYLFDEANEWINNKVFFSHLVEMEYITDLDFTLRSLNK
ncbi:HNH endonuclease [Rufibacter tibetensis]|uniref:Uncharacterized protein n=1 Tax=Rufibacter tibetensis TaxID=512763 RepID=A0A0P0C8J2_9BACT|nr:HNH endonuclease [Rufibacter tibetensis]ALI99811.1 hypothetical protein DC20_13565 [Rufibacter tibetensis]